MEKPSGSTSAEETMTVEDEHTKRSREQATPLEKVSPEKKATKTHDNATASIPLTVRRELFSPSTAQDPMPSVAAVPSQSTEASETLADTAPVAKEMPSQIETPLAAVPPAAVPPAAVPPADVPNGVPPAVKQNVPAETAEQLLLRTALDKSAQLEAALAKEKGERTAALSSMVTPPTKIRVSGTPSTTPGVSTDSQAEEGEGDDDEEEIDEKKGDLLEFPNGAKVMTHDALRMRLRRLCEKKQKSGKCHVDASTADQYHRGGEEREWLEIALIEAICKVGTVSKSHKKLRVSCHNLIATHSQATFVLVLAERK